MTYSDSVPELDGLTVEEKIEALELAMQAPAPKTPNYQSLWEQAVNLYPDLEGLIGEVNE